MHTDDKILVSHFTYRRFISEISWLWIEGSKSDTSTDHSTGEHVCIWLLDTYYFLNVPNQYTCAYIKRLPPTSAQQEHVVIEHKQKHIYQANLRTSHNRVTCLHVLQLYAHTVCFNICKCLELKHFECIHKRIYNQTLDIHYQMTN